MRFFQQTRRAVVIVGCLLLPVTGGDVLADKDEERVRLSIDFDESIDSGPTQKLLSHSRISLAKGKGPDSSDAIRVAYVGYPRGSERVLGTFPIGEGMKEATLSFDVKFDQDFQWTKGGKLHGLGPKKPITGGAERRSEGWSARIMWREEGRAQNYLYDQSPSKTFGVGDRTKAGAFQAGQWHHVEFQVRLNDPGKKNGWARTFIDGKKVLETKEVEFRGKGGDETEIQHFMFSTFHGGQSTSYSPVDEDGEFTEVNAWFDNFVVVQGVGE